MLFPILKPVLVAFIAIVTYNLSGQIITEKEYLNRPHFEITTQTDTYLFDRAGGGFSSIKDKEELEWIGFKPGNGSVPGSAAADFRGLPNLVFRGNDFAILSIFFTSNLLKSIEGISKLYRPKDIK